MLTYQQVTSLTQLLTNVFLLSRNALTDFVCHLAFPLVMVPKMESRYLDYDRDAQYQDVGGIEVGQLSNPITVPFPVSQRPVQCRDYVLDTEISPRVISESMEGSPYDALVDGTASLTHQHMMQAEKRCAAKLSDQTNFLGSSAPAVKWDAANAKVSDDLLMGLRSGLHRGNLIIMNEKVWDTTRQDKTVVESVRAHFDSLTTSALVSISQFETVFECFLGIAKAKRRNPGNIGQTRAAGAAGFEYLFGNHVAIVKTDPRVFALARMAREMYTTGMMSGGMSAEGARMLAGGAVGMLDGIVMPGHVRRDLLP